MSSTTIRSVPPTPEAIPGRYIVVFKSDTPSEKRKAHRAWAAEKNFNTLATRGHTHAHIGLTHKFNICDGQLAGYCAAVSQDTAREIEETDEVDFVEPDYKVYATKIVAQENVPSWGLARLCNTEKVTNSNRGTYVYDDEAAGKDTYSYIIDTGILAGHEDFEGRATFGYNAVPGSSNTDMNGHGTHVAGTIGSKTHGVSKMTNLIGVKVLGDDGTGSNSTVIAGIQWALRDAEAKGVTKCVANMSLGGGKSMALNRAVQAAVQRGLTIVVASGNSGVDAKEESPSSEKTAITVGAIDDGDRVMSWSNFGASVDILAPGHEITSTWIDESGGVSLKEIHSISGTSMASPHVAGLVAYLISKHGKAKTNTPAKIVALLKKLAVNGKIGGNLRGSPNTLANSGESAES